MRFLVSLLGPIIRTQNCFLALVVQEIKGHDKIQEYSKKREDDLNIRLEFFPMFKVLAEWKYIETLMKCIKH